MSKKCLICQSDNVTNHYSYLDKGLKRERHFLRCPNCSFVFLAEEDRLTQDEEKMRYDSHNNDKEDPGYINFLMKFYKPFQSYLNENHKIGLDYGAGPGPALAGIFRENNYLMDIYDPYFAPDENVINRKKYYDFISCTEAIEHFYDPMNEIEKMLELLKDGGVLGFMTQFLVERDFDKWWYKNDPTHVCFFNHQSFNYIAEKYKLSPLYIENGLAFFKKQGA
jgi:SAM-dependent methyltransferase